MEQRQVEVRGASYAVTDTGDGPPVVLLHGWPQTSATWSGLVPHLVAAGHRVVAPDLRGTGASSQETDGFGKDDQAEDLHELLDRLGVEDPVRVVGHDLGGMVAFAFARRHPDEVAGLALMELALPGLGLEQAMDVAAGGRWHFGFFMAQPYAEMLVAGHEEEFFAQWFADLAAGPLPPPAATLAAYAGREALRSSLGHYRTLLEDGRANAAWVEAGGRLEMPLLAVGGEHAVGEGLARALAGVAPGVRGAVVPASGHFVVEENLDAVVDLLLPFLAS